MRRSIDFRTVSDEIRTSPRRRRRGSIWDELIASVAEGQTVEFRIANASDPISLRHRWRRRHPGRALHVRLVREGTMVTWASEDESEIAEAAA